MLSGQTYNFKSRLWLYKGVKSSWHFFTVPEEQSAEIKFLSDGLTAGWGSIPVKVTIGNTTWKTSIFPDKKSGTYLLPVKAEIRKKEDLKVDDEININMKVI
ncbi:MAG: hypothetical protein COV35_02005 [Alphaproteobacteria bacterium CG11_big_fil_rev_8_21_14_0_20_39_49]|nr:MAG: hypothetical protein COV35_02005 [Alphaproteobacteria bacterium CG11_big_fil_rev_8_21_14_0_20_39_49]